MRTTVNIDDKLLTIVMQLAGTKNKSEAINQALAEFIRLKRGEQIRALRGHWLIDFDVKKFRELENHE